MPIGEIGAGLDVVVAAQLVDGGQPRPGDDVHLRRLVVGGEQGGQLGVDRGGRRPAVAEQGGAQGAHDPLRVAVPHREGGDSPALGHHDVAPLLERPLADPPHHGVDEAARAGPGDDLGQAHGLVGGGVGGHPHPEQLVRPEPQHVEHLRVDPVGRAAGRLGDDGVVEALPPDGAEAQLGGEGRVAPLEAVATQDGGHLEVGVGPVVDRAQQRVGGEPGGLGATGALRGRRGAALARATTAAATAGGRRRRAQPSRRSPGAIRTPRAQSAAAIGFLPCGRTSPSSTGRGGRADEHGLLADVQLAGIQRDAVAGRHHPGRTGRTRPDRPTRAPGLSARPDDPHRPDLDPLAPEGGPGPRRRGAAAHVPVDDVGRQRPAHPGLLGAQLGRQADPLAGLRHRVQRAVGEAVHRGDEQPGTGGGQPVEQRAGGVVGSHRLGERAEHRAGVEALLDDEGGGAGDVVAGHQRALHGAAPRQAGSSEKCRLTQPCTGTSSATRGTRAP